MAFEIHDAETERLVRVLAERRHVAPDEAVKLAVRNELDRDGTRPSLLERIKPIQDRIAARPSSGLVADKAFYDSLNDE